jgi:hypothetical protein
MGDENRKRRMGEGMRMKKVSSLFLHSSCFIPHVSSLIPHPSSFILHLVLPF